MPVVRATSRQGRANTQQPGMKGGLGLYGPSGGHSGRFAASAIARNSRPGVGERVSGLGRQAPVAACMVDCVPRKGGALAWHAHVYVHWEASGQSAVGRALPIPMARSAAGRGTTRDLFCGRRGCHAGVRRGSAPLTEREPAEPLDLHVTAFSSQTCTLSNIFKFVMT